MDISPLRERLAPHKALISLVPIDHGTSHYQMGNQPPGSSSPKTNDNLLHDFVQNSRMWSRERVPLPRRLRRTLWSMMPLELIWAVWLATIVTGLSHCHGPICTVVTLHHHAAALLACGVFSVAALVGLVPTTRGFARCNAIEVVGVAIASAAGGVALLGVAALLMGFATALIVLATFVLASTATSRREIDDARPRTPFPIAVPRSGDTTRARRAEPRS
jgi:hypothetical protein